MTLAEELVADGPWAGHEQEMELYGRLIGTWDVVNRFYVEDRDEWVHGTAVWTFGWVLGGRTVQDVMWFTGPGPDGYPRRRTGSTVRHYDPAGKNWNVVWFATTGTVCTLTGRAGDDGGIVQEGTQLDGRPIRWLFTDVTEESFRWLGYISDDQGGTWRLEQEMHATRR
jgi:hypothetical protein